MAEIESIRLRGTFLREDILRRLEEIKDEERRLADKSYVFMYYEQQSCKISRFLTIHCS
ncbi:hypothetical protein BH24ACI1_BH24ACI1_24940 [soil metagenome]